MTSAVIARLDAVVDDYCRRLRWLREPLTPARARMFVLQHRLNTRQRNSVLKLRVATNCPVWDTRLGIIKACSQEIIADNEYGHGKPHWEILEELGMTIGLTREEMRAVKPSRWTQMAWLAWEALMSNRHWLEGIVANVCAERPAIPGYGDGDVRRLGDTGFDRKRWAELFKLNDAQLEFFTMHSEADREHSDLGWNAIAEHAERLGMEDAVVEACRLNLMVWELYQNGFAEAADELERQKR